MTQTEIWNKANKKIFELYGKNPDLRIVNRFLSEKSALEHFGVAGYFEELSGICKESLNKHNEKLIAKNTVSCCLMAYLLGASDINPLPMHYYCPKCKRVEWLDDLDNDKCLFDMRHTRTCECGAEMRIDGYDIPWETYLPYAQRLKTKDPVPENYKDLFEALTKKHFQWSLLGAAEAVNLLGQETGVSPDEIDLSDREVKRKLFGGDFSVARPKLAAFINEVYEVVRPSDYNELIKIISFAHATFAWRSNAEELLRGGAVKLSDIPATKDELYNDLKLDMILYHQTDMGFALDVADKAAKGYYREYGMDSYTEEILYKLGYDDWFISYLLRVHYLPHKALSVLELRYLILLTYYKTYYPEQFTAVLGEENIWQKD